MKKTKVVALACTLAVPMALFLASCGAQPAQSTDANANKESTQQTQTTDNKSQTNTQSTTQTQTQTPAQTTPAQPTYIGEDAAKKAALGHAGFDESAVTDLKVELDTDDGTVHYDVDFKQGGMEYDYDINATTGEIMKSKSEVDD